MAGYLQFHAKHFQPSPSTILQTNSYPPLNTSVQRQVFTAKGLHWAFFHLPPGWLEPYSKEGIYYSVSAGGDVWSKPKYAMNDVGYPDFFSLFFDGVYLHLGYAGYKDPYLMAGGKYRKGIPNVDGTITWVAPEQKIDEMSIEYDCDPIICVDTYGNPWMGYYHETTMQWPTVIKCDRADGVWRTAPGFPYILSQESHAMSHRGAGVLPLSDGKIYALYYRAFNRISVPLPSGPIFGKLWNGNSWEPQEQVSLSHVEDLEFHQLSYVSVNDEIHLVFHAKGTRTLVYVKRDSNGWSGEIPLQTVSEEGCAPILAYSAREGKLCVLWIDNNRLFYKKGIDNDWVGAVQWVIEEPIGNFYYVKPNNLSGSFSEVEGSIDLLWNMIDSASWYEGMHSLLRHNYLLYGH